MLAASALYLLTTAPSVWSPSFKCTGQLYISNTGWFLFNSPVLALLVGLEDTADFSDDEPAPATAAQAAARAAFNDEKAADAFYSSDEDETSSHTGSFVSGSAASVTEPNKKFKVVIKVCSLHTPSLCPVTSSRSSHLMGAVYACSCQEGQLSQLLYDSEESARGQFTRVSHIACRVANLVVQSEKVKSRGGHTGRLDLPCLQLSVCKKTHGM